MTDHSGEIVRSHSLTWWGLAATGIYLTLATLYVSPRWPTILSLAPNEFGDLLAGVCSPLAFLWLVLGFMQQGQELRASVRALELQGDELRNSVEQQKQLVEVAREEMNFQIQRRIHEEEVERQRTAPKLEIKYQGDLRSADEHVKNHSFLISNFGCEVRKFEVTEQGRSQILGAIAVLGHGNPVRFQIKFPIEGVAQKTIRLGYLDDRSRELAEYWIIRIDNGKISFGPEDLMREQRD